MMPPSPDRPDPATPGAEPGPSAGAAWFEMQAQAPGTWAQRAWPWMFGILALLALILVVLHIGEIADFAALARSAQPAWLLLAFVAQAGTYVSAALVWRQVLRRAGHPRPLRALVPLGIAKLFTDQVVPSGGVSGAVLVARGLVRRRVPADVAMAALLVGLVSYFAAYLICVLASVAVLSAHGKANAALFGVVALFVVLVVAIPSAVLWARRWGRLLPSRIVVRLPGASVLLKAIADAPTGLLGNPGLIVQTVCLETAVFVLDALTLWLAACALGAAPAPWIAFVAFMVASMAATLGPIPLGLGTFEAACVATLGLLGTPIETALAATLLLRGMTFWLPMIPGLWLARREMATG
ncbi:MAG: flippase-like domain-containing protein [Proteobacteria bacterium]|nr:flippase-like domain-containing protein [Pseudomonadota bacterium]